MRPPAKVLVLVLVTARLVRVVVPEEREAMVRVPMVAVCEKRFVDDAVVLKKFVEVAFVVEAVTAPKVDV